MPIMIASWAQTLSALNMNGTSSGNFYGQIRYTPARRILDRFGRLLVDDAKHMLKRAAYGLAVRAVRGRI